MARQLQIARATNPILFIGWLIAATSPMLVAAQDSDSTQQQVFMVVKVAKEFAGDHITGTILEGAQKLGHPLNKSDVTTKPVARQFYELIATYTGTGGRSSQEASSLPVQISTLMALAPTWLLSIKDGSDRLIKEIEIEMVDGTRRTLAPKSPAPGDSAWIVAVQPGREYTIRLPSGSVPKSYSMKYVDVSDGKEKDEKNQAWQTEDDQYYLLTIANFKGNLDSLFEVIKEPTKEGEAAQVRNPFTDIRREFDIRMFVGSIGIKLPEPPIGFVQNRMTLRQPDLRKRSPKRVWVLLPLTDEGVETHIKSLQSVKDADWPGEIRKAAVPANDGDAIITPDSRPRWYELTKAGDQFERTLLLQDWKGLQEKLPTVNTLVVWEFDDGATQGPILISDEGRNSNFKKVPIENWPRGLEELRRFEEKAN